MFTERQKTMLKSVGRNHLHPNCGEENPSLDKIIDQLKLEASMSFLQPEDLINRKFVHKPFSGIAYASYIDEKMPGYE